MSDQQQKPPQRILLTWSIKLIGLAILVYLFTRLDLERVGSLLTGAEAINLVYAAALSITALNIFKVLRWHLILRWIGVDYNFVQTYITYQASVFIGLMTPGRLGEMFRSAYLKIDKELPVSAGIASTGTDRMFDLFSLLAFAGVTILLNPRYGASRQSGWYFIIAAAVLVSLLIVFRFMNPDYVRKARLFGSGFIGQLLADFNSQVRALHPWRVVILVGITLAALAVFTIQCGLLAGSIGISVDPVTAGGIASSASLIVVIPVTIYGFGTREATVITLMGMMGIGAEEAFAFALLHFLLFWVFAALWGVIFFIFKPLRIRAARAIHETAKAQSE
jgi:uncharacterized protein (TIRG00374 family)